MFDIAGNADWHLHNIELHNKRALLIRLDRKILREASFLDGRIDRKAYEGHWVSFDHLQQFFPADSAMPRAMNFIFHIGHCGSTLLSRMLDLDDRSIVYREPMIMRFLANLFRISAKINPPMPAEIITRWTNIVLKALGRNSGDGGANLVKNSSTCNNLALPLLDLDSNYRAILMHVDLHTYLAGMLKAEEYQVDITGYAAEKTDDFMRICPGFHLGGQPQLWELLVISWLSSMHDQVRALQEHPQRTVSVNFDHWLENPPEHTVQIARALQIGATDQLVETAWDTLGSQYAKNTDVAYSPQMRSDELEVSARRNRCLIQNALDRASQLIETWPQLAPLNEFLRR